MKKIPSNVLVLNATTSLTAVVVVCLSFLTALAHMSQQRDGGQPMYWSQLLPYASLVALFGGVSGPRVGVDVPRGGAGGLGRLGGRVGRRQPYYANAAAATPCRIIQKQHVARFAIQPCDPETKAHSIWHAVKRVMFIHCHPSHSSPVGHLLN